MSGVDKTMALVGHRWADLLEAHEGWPVGRMDMLEGACLTCWVFTHVVSIVKFLCVFFRKVIQR